MKKRAVTRNWQIKSRLEEILDLCREATSPVDINLNLVIEEINRHAEVCLSVLSRESNKK